MRTYILITGLLSAALLLAQCTGAGNRASVPVGSKGSGADHSAAVSAVAPEGFTIFYNNDQFAYLQPCGCRINPIGGLHRRWNAMSSVPAERRLFFDAGNLLYKSNGVPGYLKEQWNEQAMGLIEAYNLFKVDAITVGPNDFAAGLKQFLKLKAAARFPIISANIFYRKTGRRLLPANTVVEKAGVRIGVFGVTDPLLSLPPELKATDAFQAAREQVEELQKKDVDMIVAITHQGLDLDEELADKVEDINLIVGGHSQSFLQSPIRTNDTTIVQLSSQGMMLGRLDYKIVEGKPRLHENEVLELSKEYDLTPSGVRNPMKPLIAVVDMRIAKVNKEQQEREWKKHKAMGSKFQTFMNCKSCHQVQAKFQDQKRHSAAFFTLVARKAERNRDCMKCHSVGLGEPGGFSGMQNALLTKEGQPVDYQKVITSAEVAAPGTDYRKAPELIEPHVRRWQEALKKHEVAKAFVGVQCENCHGTVRDHPFAGGRFKAVNAASCTSCHTAEQMPAWYDGKGELKLNIVSAAIKKLSCPKQ